MFLGGLDAALTITGGNCKKYPKVIIQNPPNVKAFCCFSFFSLHDSPSKTMKNAFCFI